MLKDLGFEEAELARSWNGEAKSLCAITVCTYSSATRFSGLTQQKAAAAVKRPDPPVQRPGVAQTKNAGREVQIAQLSKQLENASGQNATRIAAALVAARRAAR